MRSQQLEARWRDRLALAQGTAARSVETGSFLKREPALRATGGINDESKKA
jgi:hypothetical protein